MRVDNKYPDKINREFLESIGVTDEQIFEYYFPEPIDPNRGYTNPLRQSDDYPTCRFYKHKDSGYLYFSDKAYKTYDAYQFVMDMFNINYLTACEKIYYDLGYVTGTPKPKSLIVPVKKPSIVLVSRRSYTKLHLDFWREHDETVTINDLEDSKIYALGTAWLNDKIFFNHRWDNVAFYYHLRKGYNYQCYKPTMFFDGVKFITSNDNYIVGWSKFKFNHHYAVIGKSGKCTFFLQRFGINAIGLLIELTVIDKETWNYFFKNIPVVFTLFDPDRTGKRLAAKYRRTYGTIPLFFDQSQGDEKDFSDNLKKYKSNYMNDYIRYVMDKMNIPFL